jgi:hypothetical protein
MAAYTVDGYTISVVVIEPSGRTLAPGQAFDNPSQWLRDAKKT